jgi:hypothetical protein
MKAIIIVVITISVMASGFSFADQVSLPGLIGEYSAALGERMVMFDFGGNVGEISSVYLELYGTVHTSWVSADGDTSMWGGEFSASLMEPEPGFWFGSTHWSLSGEFHTIVAFSSIGGATWDFLSDGQGEITFGFFPFGLVGLIDGTGPEPTGTISSATLIIEGPVATESRSFGHIKSLYR